MHDNQNGVRETTTSSDVQYDVFLSYSSIDLDQAIRVHKFLENYRHPRGLFGPNDVRIKVFRDKTDQGLTSNFSEAFKAQILNTKSFLLLGSKNSVASGHVMFECECVLQNDRQSILLAQLDETHTESFPANILDHFPNAIRADLRMIRRINFWKWWMRDRSRFHDEMLRILSAILTTKSGFQLSYDTLKQRERKRANRRKMIFGSAFMIFLIALFAYYATTEKYGLHYTVIGRNQVEKIIPGDSTTKAAFFAGTNERRFWSDTEGHEGFDTDIVVHALDEQGTPLGKLEFTYSDEFESISEPQLSGVFDQMSDASIKFILDEFNFASTDTITRENISQFSFNDTTKEIGDLSLFHPFDQRHGFQVIGNDHTPPSVAYFTDDAGKHWTRTKDFPFHLKRASIWSMGGQQGLTFVGSPEEIDPYYPCKGGLFRTTDFGRHWEEINPGDVDALIMIAGNPRNTEYMAAVIGVSDRSGDVTSSGLWVTKDGGDWQYAGFTSSARDIQELYVLADGEIVVLTENGVLLMYRQRRIIDRLLQRYEVSDYRYR